MELKELEKIGLTTNEAKIFIALLELGQAQAGKISKQSQINRTTTYDSLDRLIEKGLVTYTIQANKKLFKPVPPQTLLDQQKEKQKAIEQLLPELNTIFKKSKDREESDIYKGRKGIKSILNNILNYKEYISFGSSGKFLEIMKHDFTIFQKRKKQLNIKAKVILAESAKNTEQVKTAHAQFKYIKDEFFSPTTTFVYGNKTAIIIWGQIPTATLITSKEVATSYKNYFNILWQTAKA